MDERLEGLEVTARAREDWRTGDREDVGERKKERRNDSEITPFIKWLTVTMEPNQRRVECGVMKVIVNLRQRGMRYPQPQPSSPSGAAPQPKNSTPLLRTQRTQDIQIETSSWRHPCRSAWIASRLSAGNRGWITQLEPSRCPAAPRIRIIRCSHGRAGWLRADGTLAVYTLRDSLPAQASTVNRLRSCIGTHLPVDPNPTLLSRRQLPRAQPPRTKMKHGTVTANSKRRVEQMALVVD
ncbi:hypothetical protein FB45DRAFT_871841 [Roridomyces roridus]|uniref:Uncharacterized protein n=1 Tax=Roridomyces roridus TaxID=1738132 RepID=A0AAD7FET7_9AGAR|nr:hypothetical protein FB45DRAFT_871841 [Roridomyces roridus]